MRIYFEKLNQIRKDKKITISELCDKMRISKSTYFRWQQGKKAPSKAHIYFMAKELNIDIAEFTNASNEDLVSYNKETESSSLHWLKNKDNTQNTDFSSLKEIINQISKFEKKYHSMKEFTDALFHSINIPIYIKDNKLQYIEANLAFKNLFSLKNDYCVTGKLDSDFLNRKETNSNSTQDASVLETGKAIRNYEQAIPGTKNKKWCLCSKIPIYHKSIVDGVLGLFFDITEKKRAALLNEQLRINLDNMSSMITIFDINNNKLLYANKLAYDYIDLPLETYYKLPLKERLKKRLSEEDYKQINWNNSDFEILKDMKEYKFIDKNGNIKFLEATTKLQSFNKIDSIVRIRRDVTDKKKKEILQNIIIKMIYSFGFGFSIIDMENNKALYKNYSVSKVLGYTEEDVQNKGDDFYFSKIENPDDLKNVKTVLKKGEGVVIYRMTDSNNQQKCIKLMCTKSIYDNKECMFRINGIISEGEFDYLNKINSIAKRLKNKGLPVDEIAEITELPKEIILKL